tara:strand:- start:562 stop:873 length:312 start_codon:yes stop_codon:yes gene_type:complete
MKKKIVFIYNKLPRWMKNRYFISSVLFFIWMFFFDTNSMLIQIKQKREIKKIENNIQYYNQEIKSDNMKIEILSNDTLTTELEKYLRENLFLSKKNEEVFIIE